MRTMRTILASTTVLLMAASAFCQLKKNDIEKLHEAAAHRMSRNPEPTGDG
jgi:hypothetical protein